MFVWSLLLHRNKSLPGREGGRYRRGLISPIFLAEGLSLVEMQIIVICRCRTLIEKRGLASNVL